MNLKEMRKDWTDQLVCETAKNHKLVWLDQDLLNILCSKDEIKILDEKYNYQSRHKKMEVNTDGVILLHYVAKPKPWEVSKLKPHEILWWEVALPLQLEGVPKIDLSKLKH